jgi:hypothetical protein
MNRPLFLASLALVALCTGCATGSTPQSVGHILVVDAHGVAVQGALLMADRDEDDPSVAPADGRREEALMSDSDGLIAVRWEDLRWESDGCYHFHIQRRGFEEADMTVAPQSPTATIRVVLQRKAPGSG